MGIVEVIVLGIVQGLTEFIPVSSSGHLVIVQHLFSGTSDHLLLEFINLGTFIALLVYFRERITAILRSIVCDRNYKLARNILLTSIPAGMAGLLLSDIIAHSELFGSLITVIVTLTVVGSVMIVVDRVARVPHMVDGEELSPVKSLGIGVAQMAALIPGVSRSGVTIIAGRFAGLTPAAAAEYSFLASIPIMLAVALKNFIKSGDRAYFMDNMLLIIIGNIAAFIAGLVAIGFLMNYLKKHGLAVFGWYRLGLALLLLVYAVVVQ